MLFQHFDCQYCNIHAALTPNFIKFINLEHNYHPGVPLSDEKPVVVQVRMFLEMRVLE